MHPIYNYIELTAWLEKKGQEQFDNHFKILEPDYPVIHKLLAYYTKDEPTCHQLGISLNKGIMLSGPVGSGKTSLMNLMRHIAVKETKFSVKSCREISFEFIQDGYEIIHRYSKGKLYESNSKIICFDDLGAENNLKYFGNECNVMAEILLSRYELFTHKKLITHITTNLSASEIEMTYGNRVRSRMREMVNQISFDKNTKDKR
ncbi:hypothetical protein FLJC2902T_12960 [Flavobacterium limnosediminis JC2902]|uniref:ATPase AAA-type core domain-containing protein n=1 Tax=Flavobacterium limnosediminis JC2902 TaxID=1341181 RepID=V6SWC8_9FLAO|nr:AAA family ATPase [Flavobacterium limnosediminis]ESU28705.1 hypothetical protein FLJC2902T_12960 [Flavobacterium limnosediminis JC2902]